MNLLKWLKNKAGKMPVTITQAAGITAVVGAAGFAAMSYLSSPADNNTSFMPPSVYEQQGDVVYVSQSGGGGQYTSNGEVASSFHATQSDSIRLANQRYEREQQARALEETDTQPSYAGGEDSSIQLPKAYQMVAGEMGLGAGDGSDKQLNGALDMFANLQKDIPGLSAAVDNAQAKAVAGKAADKGGTSGQTAAQLANAPRNWGQGGTVRAGSGSNVDNSFTIQNSGKNQNSKEASAALAQAGNVMADAQAMMKQMKEGSRMQSSRASFGRSEGLGDDKDARGQGWRRNYGNARSELAMIRKQTANIDKNGTNSANEAGRPFLSSAQISGGLTVDEGSQITTGQGSSSGDLNTTDRQMRGIKGWATSVANVMEKRTGDRHNIRKWMWWALPLALVTIPLIGAFATIGRAGIPIVSAIAWACAAVLAVLTLWPTIKLLAAGINYANTYGSDAYATIGMILGGLLTAGVGVALAVPGVGRWLGKLPIKVIGYAAGVGFGGATIFHFLSKGGEGVDAADLDDNANGNEWENEEENPDSAGGKK